MNLKDLMSEFDSVSDPDARKVAKDCARAGAQAAAFEYRSYIRKMYGVLGLSPSTCKSCGKGIWWATTKNGKKIPYTEDGICHFVDCPSANQHRRSR